MNKIANEDLKDYCTNEDTKIILLERYIPEFTEETLEEDINKFVTGFEASDAANDLLFVVLCLLDCMYEEQSLESVIQLLDGLLFSISYDNGKFLNQVMEILLMEGKYPTAVLEYDEFRMLDQVTQLALISECKRVVKFSDYKEVLRNFFNN